jgi:uncharacterized DUF497 family protein
MPEYEWDELKRAINRQKHELDLLDAKPLFDGRKTLTILSRRFEEERFKTTGEIDGRFYTAVWT